MEVKPDKQGGFVIFDAQKRYIMLTQEEMDDLIPEMMKNIRQWRERMRRRKYSLDYYYRNREERMAKAKIYREKNKDIIKAKRRMKRIKYYETDNKEIQKHLPG